jgi:hypothetical protein
MTQRENAYINPAKSHSAYFLHSFKHGSNFGHPSLLDHKNGGLPVSSGTPTDINLDTKSVNILPLDLPKGYHCLSK